ncbi:hypothetical protein [Vibrio ishigakensis]|nr:hypothetical protein [Vibrio ishigakensis]
MTDALLQEEQIFLHELQELYLKLKETSTEIQQHEDNLRTEETGS